MKTRLLSILSVFACLFALLFVTVAPVKAAAPEYTAETFAEYTNTWIENWFTGEKAAVDSMNEEYASYGMPVTWDVTEEAYKAEVEKTGGFKAYGEASCTTEGNIVTVTQEVEGVERNITFKFSWDMQAGTIVWTTDVIATSGETFVKACLNTLMGMGTVFVVLIFISFIIALFAVFSMIGKKAAKPVETPVAPVAEVVADDTNDDEIIAVIAAAIAAYEADGNAEAPADGLVVRSIKKRGFAN